MNKVFDQASRDKTSTRIVTDHSVSYIFKGVKIENRSGDIVILNTKFNGDYYSEISPEEYLVFKRHGWKVGCCVIATKNNSRSLNNVSDKISAEIKTMSNLRRYNTLVKYRDTVINRFVETINILKLETCSSQR